MRNLFVPIIASIVLCSFTGAYAQTPTPNADLNHDGTVDEADLLLVVGQWHVGETYTPTPTQTPFTPTPTPPGEITINLPNLPVGAKPLVLVRVPAGSFQMGSPDTERSRDGDEEPVHTVNIRYDFYMGKYEVTQAQWQAVMGSNPSHFKGDDLPVEQVSWNDCQTFIAALYVVGQGTFRLPSEAEWEYACRAGTTTRFYFGDSLGCADDCSDCAAGVLPGNRLDYMWYCGNSSSTKVVGQKLPNDFGLYDMHGNVSEWCQDWYYSSYVGAPSDGSACEVGGSEYRVIRGGLWLSSARYCRSSDRYSGLPDYLYSNIGFRIARTASLPNTPTNTPTPTPTPETITVDLPGLPEEAVPLVLVRIPAGSFQMGSDDTGWSSSQEVPVHTVDIANDFYIGKYEVTQAQWQAVMLTASPSDFKGDSLPVEMVSWDDCQTFITELNRIAGGKFRLPSEAEWEYACRAGTTTRFSFGDSICSATGCTSCDLDSYAWWCGNSDNTTHPVGGKLPNDWGLYDMHGNVFEWCQDWWNDSYTGAPADGSAWESGDVLLRVSRGGAWLNNAGYCRSSNRDYNNPDIRSNYLGFRLCRTRSRTP